MTQIIGLGSSSRKRAADSDIGGVHPKRQHPDIVSPWIRRIE
jgi:hypothetical protein